MYYYFAQDNCSHKKSGDPEDEEKPVPPALAFRANHGASNQDQPAS